MDYIRYFEQQQIKDIKRPQLQSGDIVRVTTKVQEGEKTRLQIFEGTLISIRGSGPSTTFTVRHEVVGFGVERIFPLYSPLITDIEIVRRQKVRRAKLTYLRHSGRRRFKDDVAAMQRYIRQEQNKKRLAEEARRREEEEAMKAEKEAVKKAQAEQAAQQEEPTVGSTDNKEIAPEK